MEEHWHSVLFLVVETLDGPTEPVRIDRVRAVVRGAVTFDPSLGDATPEVAKFPGDHVSRVHVLPPHEVMSTALWIH